MAVKVFWPPRFRQLVTSSTRAIGRTCGAGHSPPKRGRRPLSWLIVANAYLLCAAVLLELVHRAPPMDVLGD